MDRRMSLEDEHEVEQDERRRLVAALVTGDEAPDSPVPGPWGPLVAGLAVALALVLVVGMGTLVKASLPGGRPSPTPHPAVSVPAHR